MTYEDIKKVTKSAKKIVIRYYLLDITFLKAVV
jgi:hypothetical protein